MPKPNGSLTATQLEIMEVVWECAGQGMTGSEIWQQIAGRRKVVRTTILNQVDRLEKRGWLRRKQRDGGARYSATLSREATENRLAQEFVNDFFNGSVSTLVSRLFGGGSISPEDLEKMQAMIDSLPPQSNSRLNQDSDGGKEK